MASKYEGQRFGRVQVIDSEMRGTKQYFGLKCDCGHEYYTRATNVLSGAVTQCLACKKGSNTRLLDAVPEFKYTPGA